MDMKIELGRVGGRVYIDGREVEQVVDLKIDAGAGRANYVHLKLCPSNVRVICKDDLQNPAIRTLVVGKEAG